MTTHSVVCIIDTMLGSFLPPANSVWGKVICLQACVCQQGGVPDQVHPREQTAPRNTNPREQTPPGADTNPKTRYIPPRPGTPPGSRRPPKTRYPPDQVHPSPRPGTPPKTRYTPTTTAAGGTHPTGMHSCF